MKLYQQLGFVLVFSISMGAMAHEKEYQCHKQLLTSDQVDSTKHCVFESQLYSRGAVIEQRGREYVCDKVSRAAEPFALGWDKD